MQKAGAFIPSRSTTVGQTLMKKVLVIAGTRPEVVKMAPVVHALRSRPADFAVRLCSTGQHRQMLEQTFADFGLVPDVTLNVMTGNQTLSMLSARLFESVDTLLADAAPDVVLVQGDTTTVQVASLCAFYRGIAVGHVEAGLRTWNMLSPFPEELNRRVTGLVARWHYAPTELGKSNLLLERVPAESIIVCGNTVVDALLMTLRAARRDPPPLPPRVEAAIEEGRQIVLVTGHRRESFGDGLRNICAALVEVARSMPQARIVYPVHLNPNVQGPVYELLGAEPNIFLEAPLPYRTFVRLMDSCTMILTDSGGIQEEGPSLNKPVLIMRSTTERPEGVDAGVNLLVGTSSKAIVAATLDLLQHPESIASMASRQNPYGDGKAAQRIAEHLARQ